MYEITMPKLSDSMQEGRIIAWKVKAGDRVREGDVLAEVESDKATMELECFHSGVLSKIVHGDGSEVSVGEVIGYIDAEAKAPATASAPEPATKPEVRKSAKEAPSPKPERAAPAKPVAPKPTETPIAVEARKPAESRIAASPRARKLAEEKRIDLSRIKGSGPDGRIIAQDVEAFSPGRAPEGKASSAAAPTAEPTPSGATPEEKKPAIKPSPDEELPAIDATAEEADIEEASFRQKTLARRVTAAKHVIPHFYITRGVDVTRLLARKDELKQKYGASITHMVMLACLKALKLHPEANRSYDRGRIIKWKGINLGLAVDTDEGLTVGVMRSAEKLSLKEIVERAKSLVEKARSGKLSPDERRHPTFTVSSLGMFDVEQFEAIINPPSAITLAVASALPAPVVTGDAISVGRVMKLTLSCDHRIVDGVTAAKFLADLKRLLENDEELLSE